jgi:GNAT superfamily N-acetyltransferase
MYLGSMPEAPRLVLRAATAADAPILARHRVEMFRDMGRLAHDGVAEALRAAAEPELRAWVADGRYVGFLAAPAERPDQVVGGAGIQLRALLPRPSPDGTAVLGGPEAYVLNVYVEREWRRRGIAAQLMARVLAYARERDLKVITLHPSDAGRPLYERLGFRPTSEMRLR